MVLFTRTSSVTTTSCFRSSGWNTWKVCATAVILALLIKSDVSAQSAAVCDTAVAPANFEVDGNLYAKTLSSFSDDWFSTSASSPGIGLIGQTAASAMPPLKISAASFRALLQAAVTADQRNIRYEQRFSVPQGTAQPSASGYSLIYDALSARDNFSVSGSIDSSIFISGKNGDNPLTAWTVGQGSVPANNEIIDIGANFRRQYSSLGAKGDIWGYGYATNLMANGDVHYDFEFLRTQPQLDVASGVVSSTGPALTGGHSRFYFDSTATATEVGDAIFSIDMASGAVSPRVSVSVWVDTSDLGNGINGWADFNTKVNRPFEFTGVFASGSNTNGYGYAEIRPKASVTSCVFYARVNRFNSCKIPAAPWGTVYGSGASFADSLECLQFVEFSMDVTKFGLEGIVGTFDCNTPNAAMIVKTRDNASFTSNLVDFAGPYKLGNLANAVAGPDKVRNCTNPTVTLEGQSYTPYAQISWSVVPGSGGHILSGANTLNPVVDTAGKYVLSVSSPAPLTCVATDTVEVIDDFKLPKANAYSSNDITCSNPTTTISVSAAPSLSNSIVSYLWSPGGQTDTSFTTSVGGTYTVTVTQTNGCTGTASCIAKVDTCVPVLSATSSGPITCANPTSTVSVSATACTGDSIASYSWSSGATTSSFSASASGSYTVTVTQSVNGCTSSATATVVTDISTPTVSCSAAGNITCTSSSTTLSANATASSGNTITGYSWSPGGSTASSITVTNGSTYTVTVTQSNGCTSSSSCNAVVDTCRPTVSASNNGPITCTNPSRTVSATATACSGKSIASYSWSPTGSGASFTTTAAGTYTVTVTQSGNGCTASASTTLQSNVSTPFISCSPSGNITCSNSSTTLSASAVASSGNTISGYSWSPGGSTASTITVSNGSTYTVTVTQSNGCTASSSCSAVVDTCRPTVSATNNGPIACLNTTRTISATATACSGKSITSYSWSPSGSGASFTTSTAGTYTVTVTQSGNGCTATASTTLQANTNPPTISCSAAGAITCSNGTTTLSASASAASGSTITGYSWSPGGSTASSITVNNGSTYTVTVTQSNGCTASSSCSAVVDTCRPALSATNNGPITCTNPSRTVSASATACAGKSIASYAWTPSGSGASFTTTSAGTYTVTVTQSGNGCTASASTTLQSNVSAPAVSCSAAGAITCTNSSTTLSATATASSGNTISGYSWSPGGSTTSSITVNNSTTYTVTVTQSNGCTATSSCSAAVDTCRPTVSATNNGPITCLNTTRTVAATAVACSGKTIASYSWSPSGSGSSFTTSTAGVYTVIVTQSGNGCTATASTTLQSNAAAPTVTCSAAGSITCTNTSTTLTAVATPASGNSITRYSWSPGGSTASSITVTNGATYTVTVTQTNGCTATSSCSAVVDTCRPTLAVSNNGPITCTNANPTVTAAAVACAGKTISSYVWSPAGTGSSFTTNIARTYSVTITQSGNGCTASGSTTLTVDTCRPTVTASNNGPLTCANSPRTVTATATACTGKTIASYAWTPNGSGASFTTATAATFTVTVTQSGNGCTATATTIMSADTCRPSVSATNNGPITCINTSRTVSATATACSGRRISNYAWSSVGGSGSSNTSFSTSTAGTYTVTVTQSGNGCTASASTTLLSNTTPPAVNCSASGAITCSLNNATLSSGASATGGNTITGYLWSPGNSTSSSITVTNGSTYTVTVTQSNGCTASSSCSAPVDTCRPVVSVTNNGPLTCSNAPRTVTATATPCAGKTITSYAWTPSGSGSSFTTSTAATYRVTVTQSGNGCTATGSTVMSADTCRPTVSATNNGPITCVNTSRTVSATATACTGKTITAYSWTPSGSGTSFTTSTAGTYTVTVTQSGNGCTASASTTLQSNVTTPTVSCNAAGSITCTNTSTTLSVTATPSAGNSITSYSWSPGGSTASSITVTNGSTYSVIVTQSNGCAASTSCNAVVDTCRPSLTVSNNGPITCNSGARTITATATACAGKTITSYSWSPTGSGSSFTTSTPGTYTVIVTQSGNGCTATGSTTLTSTVQPPTVSCSASNTIKCSTPTAVLTVAATPYSGTTITGYSWSPGGATTASITVSNGATYTVTVTQSNGCTASTSCSAVVQTSPTVLSVSASSTNTSTTTTSTGSVTATASGGTSPYTYLWNTGATTATVNNLGVGTYTVTVTDALGCTATASTTVQAGICSGFVTYTQEQWGSSNNRYEPTKTFNPLFNSYFVAPNYLTIGCNNKLRLTRSNELDKFLPSSGTSNPLPTGTLVDPGLNYGNTLAGEAVALTLNVIFDSANASFSTATTYFKDQIVVSGTFANYTVRQVLAEVNKYLGGCGSTFTSSQLVSAAQAINRNYEQGTVDRGYLRCPNTPRLSYFGAQKDDGRMIVYPNPTDGNCKLSLTGSVVGDAQVVIYNLMGELVYSKHVLVNTESDFIVDLQLKEAGIAGGLYLIRFVQEGQVHESRLMISY